MERTRMKQNTITEEAKSKVDKKPDSNFTSLAKFPLWLVTSFVLFLASLVSLIYFFLKGREGKSRSQQGNSSVVELPEPKRLDRDMIKDKPVFNEPAADIVQPEPKRNPILGWFEIFISRLFPTLTAEQVKTISFSTVGLLLVIAVAYIAQSIFDATTVEGGLGISFTLFLASLVFLVYFFLRNSKIKRREEKISASHTGVELTEQKGNPLVERFESLSANPSVERMPYKTSLVIGVLMALVFAYVAQGVFDSIKNEGVLQNLAWLGALSESSRLWLGAGIYLACMLTWSLAAPAMPSIDSVINLPFVSTGKYHRFIRFFLYVSIGLYLMSIVLFAVIGENALIRGLWVAGLICFILSQLSRTNSHPQAEESPRFQWHHWLILALILGAAFWLRFYKVSIIPDDFHGDMAEHGWIARNYLLGVEKDIFGYGFYGIPLMGFLPATFSMAVFGNNIFGLQMTAVLGGMLNLFAVYLFIWRLFNSHRLAALTTVLTAINITHIHFSRIVENMDPWTFGVFALFFLIDGLKARRVTSFGLAGVFLGISMQMYFSGRALAFIIGFFLIYAFFFRRDWIIQNKHSLYWVVVGALVAMGPALISHLMHWEDYVGRARGVFIFSPDALQHLFYGYNTNSVWVVLLTQIRRSLLMFNYTNDTSGQFGYPHPMFSSLVSPLIVLGLGFALRRWKDAGMAFMLIWLVLMLVLGSILTIDPPFGPRLVGIIPAAAFLAAAALDQLLELGRKIFGTQAFAFIAALMAIFLVAVGYLNWNEYYQVVKDNATPPTVAGRYISRLPLDVTACGIFNEFKFSGHGTTTFMIWPRKLVDVEPDAPDADLEKCTGSSLVWAISPENIGRLDAIRSRWPNGIVQKLTRHDYTLTFYLVGVAPPDPQFGASE
jgi:hypothetical protein